VRGSGAGYLIDRIFTGHPGLAGPGGPARRRMREDPACGLDQETAPGQDPSHIPGPCYRKKISESLSMSTSMRLFNLAVRNEHHAVYTLEHQFSEAL